MTNSNGRFENVLLELWKELPHEIMLGRAKSLETVRTLKRWGIPLGVPEKVAAGGFAIAEFAARDYATAHWAWAVPDEQAIRTLVQCSPIVEIGAGTGYWARLAADAGADIVAYDSRPPVAGRKNAVAWAVETGTFFPVRRGGPGMVRFHQDRTLFLCWPPHSHDMAFDSLRRYKGGRVIYVGENGGCTADDQFHDLLDKHWEAVKVVAIPQWHGLHDRMFIFKRKEKRRR
jgi:hypothetical protein